jgi:hypothetical protein
VNGRLLVANVPRCFPILKVTSTTASTRITPVIASRLVSRLLERFRIWCRPPCPILFAAFLRKGWEANKSLVYGISENVLAGGIHAFSERSGNACAALESTSVNPTAVV